MSNNNSAFSSVTVFVLAKNETDLLRQTVAEIRKNCSDEDLEKIIVVTKNADCPGYFEACKMIEEKLCHKLEVYVQRLDNGINCLIDLPYLVTGSHFVIIASDMEMDPRCVGLFVEKAKENPEKIICASKWMKGSVVEGCGKIHEIGSRVMNGAVALLFGIKAKEIFSLYQIYPVSVWKKTNFDNPKAFMYEYTLKAMRLGAAYEEIPTSYKARREGKSTFNHPITMVIMALKFCITALRIRFTPKRYLNGEKTR